MSVISCNILDTLTLRCLSRQKKVTDSAHALMIASKGEFDVASNYPLANKDFSLSLKYCAIVALSMPNGPEIKTNRPYPPRPSYSTE